MKTLADQTRFTEAELLALHGMGPNAMKSLRGTVRAHVLNFKE